jgi:Conjugative transposon protein TcpC
VSAERAARRSSSDGLSLRTRPIWLLRARAELPRVLLGLLTLWGLAASARFALAPPRAWTPAQAPASTPSDRGAEGFATLFARRYLEWSAADPTAFDRALSAYEGPGVEAGAGFSLPAGGAQHVLWAEVVQARETGIGRHVYTVAVQTDAAGLVYLAVPVTRAPGRGLSLDGYPALVGAPAAGPSQAPQRLDEVTDGALSTVVQRALRNYLAGSAGELAADLAPGAQVSAPAGGFSLLALDRLQWEPDRRSVLALVEAGDVRGARYLLEYELDVARAQGRWEVGAIEMDPLA